MPTRADIEAATPKCRGKQAPAKKTNFPIQRETVVCGEPLRYNHLKRTWTCTEHGDVLTDVDASEHYRIAK